MSFLTVYADHADYQQEAPLIDTQDAQVIQAYLAEHGIDFTRWQASQAVNADSTQAEILAAYDQEVQALKQARGFTTADVIHLTAAHPEKAALRQKFLAEHRHSEDEVRFFVSGRGLFCLHLEGKVALVGCERHDLISVPAGAKHWFDMGAEPEFTCVRLFTNPEGWVADFTGDKIAEKFPHFEQVATKFAS